MYDTSETTVAAVNARTDHQLRVLRALGVTSYGLRAPFGSKQAEPDIHEASPSIPMATSGDVPECVLVLPADCNARDRAQVQRVMQALGGVFAQAPQVDVVADELQTTPPSARAYLAFGETQARALGRSLSTDVMAQAEVLLLDTPEALFQPAGKRRLWQAIGGLRRHWRGMAEGGV